MSEAEAFRSLAFILGSAALAPLLLGLLPKVRLPEVVLLLALGMIIGPYGLELASVDTRIGFLSDLGLGMLFLLAGIEVDPLIVRTADGGKAVLAWVISLAVALGLMFVLARAFDVSAWVAVAIAMTSTALGTLLPMLRETGLQSQRMGRLVAGQRRHRRVRPDPRDECVPQRRHGVRWPGVAARLRCRRGRSSATSWSATALVCERVSAVVRRGTDTTAQAPLRLVLLLLVVMLAASTALRLDVILGAFVAGAIIRMLLPDDHGWFLARLDAVGYGFLIPVFFVVSGMGIDAGVLVDRLALTLFVFASILLVRGGSVYAVFRHLDRRPRLTLGLFSATGLPIIVAVTTVAVASGNMPQEEQSIVVAAGMLTVLCLPVLALALHRPDVPVEA